MYIMFMTLLKFIVTDILRLLKISQINIITIWNMNRDLMHTQFIVLIYNMDQMRTSGTEPSSAIPS